MQTNHYVVSTVSRLQKAYEHLLNYRFNSQKTPAVKGIKQVSKYSNEPKTIFIANIPSESKKIILPRRWFM